MAKFMTNLPPHLINPVISSLAIILGALIGGFFSWIITKKSTDRTIEVQNRIVKDNRKHEEDIRLRKSEECVNVIRLDICTALFQSIRILKALEKDKSTFIYPVPMDKQYALSVAYMKNSFTLRELSYIYQLYGIIEKLNKDSNEFDYKTNNYENIKMDCIMLLKKLYGDNIDKILEEDIEKSKYQDLYANNLIKTGYRNVFEKLDKICN